MRTPFKLRSASPFKNDKKMVHNEGGENVLKNVNVTKGKKSIYTYKQLHKDTLAKGGSQADADKAVSDARASNMSIHGTHNPTKEGLENNYREEKGSMKMEDIKKPGKEGQDGAYMDSFSPQETRMSIREFKVNDNRFNRRGNKDRKYNNRYEKGLGFDPSTLNDELKASDPNKYKELDLRKQAYDKSRKGEKQLMKISQNKREMDYYDNRTKNSEMAGKQGVNQNDGTKIEYDPDMLGPQKKTASTPGSDKTILTDKEAEGYENTDSVDLGANVSDSSYTESLSGGSNKPIGGAGPADPGSADSSTETTETGNSFLKTEGNKLLGNIKAMGTGGMGALLLNQIDADGDGDTAFNDTNNDGTMLSRFMSKITGGDDKDAQMVGSSATKYGRKGGAPFKMTKNK